MRWVWSEGVLNRPHQKKKVVRLGDGGEVGDNNLFTGEKGGERVCYLDCYVHSDITYTTRDPCVFLGKVSWEGFLERKAGIIKE